MGTSAARWWFVVDTSLRSSSGKDVETQLLKHIYETGRGDNMT
jgi:hypothetical protein